jgi:concanavalin A-like lectin/glucanase superfamily protein/Big-like domain-containing protein/ASPM-SPD-2-Hydin domain-containing protein
MKLASPRRLIALVILCCFALTARAQTLSPASLSFGNWVVQTTSPAKTVILKNTQKVPLTISSISVSGDFEQTSTCPIASGTLAAGASCNISVTFTPAALGLLKGTLTVTDNAANSPQTAQLTGTGVAPAGLTPSSLAFGNQVVGTTSAAKVTTLQNNQTVPLTIAGISTSGNFAQTSNCPLSPYTLGAGASCTISVTFTPLAVGSLTGTLTVNDNAPNSPQAAQLSGTGTAPVTLSPASLSFGSQVFGTTSAKQTVTLKNTQTGPLTISGVSTSGNFAQTSNCPLSPNTLGAAASCTISVTFTPTALGTRTGTLTITDNAGTSPQTVGLSGTGTLAGLLSISISPSNPNLSIGNQLQFVATGTWKGGLSVNISPVVGWSSSAPSVASVNSTGLAQGATQGVATITAGSGSVSGSTTITVVTPSVTSIAVVPDNPSVPLGANQQFTAELSYSDGSTKETTNLVSWSSSSTAVATVSSTGVTSALAAGSTTITATAESVTGSTTLSVFQPPCVAAPSGLVGWWTGDGNTVDIAGYNSGTLQNGATYGNGEVGQAFSFAGNGASVFVNSQVYPPAAGTLMFWFMPTAAGSMTGSFDGRNRTPGLAVDANGNLNWEFGNLSAQVLGQVGFNQWSNVALTYSTSNSEVAVSVYLNGNLAASAIAAENSSWYPQLALGAYLGAQKPSFVGSMDEVAIFNQALSAQQIQQIYNAFSGGMCKPTLQSIALTPVSPSMAPGLLQQFDAVGSYSDGTAHDLTTSATWSSSNPAVATVNGSGKATTVAIGNATITAALGGETGSTSLSVVPSLVSLQVNPPTPSIAAGTTQAFTATGTFSDGSTQNLTASVSWSSSAPSVASIAAGGLANGTAAGQTTIAATADSVSGSTVLTVTPATLSTITVAPVNPTIASGTTQSFTATGFFSDGSTQNLTTSVTWSSSTSVATINTSGVATGLAPGQATITASLGSVSNSAVLTVTTAVLTSIAVNPVNPSVFVGSAQQFTATGTYSDNSTQDLTNSATWTSSNTNIASISATGLASSLAVGTTTIGATVLTVSGSTTLTVTLSPPPLQSISVTPANPSVAIGQNQQFVATGVYADGSTQDLTSSVSWNSSTPSAATINASGLAIGLATGQTTITASLGSISNSAVLTVTTVVLVSIAVNPVNPSLLVGGTQQFTATGTYSDNSTQDLTNSATWTSSNASAASISSTGLASGLAVGATTIGATVLSVSGSTTLTVTLSLHLLQSISITPANPSVAIGQNQQFVATGLYADGTTQDLTSSVNWNSSQPSVAAIASGGLATGLSGGSTTITAAVGAINASATLSVNSIALVSIAVTPGNATIALGTNQQFAAIATYADGSTLDLTTSANWSSSSPPVAMTNASGLATSASVGQTTITAAAVGITGSSTLTVTAATLVSIAITPAISTISLGTTEQFAASGTFTDGSTQDITGSVQWASSDTTIATIGNAPGAQGLAVSVADGSSSISATSGSISASTTLTVSAAALVSITVNPSGPSIALGTTQQFTATGIFTDGSTQDLTTSSTWASGNIAVATVSSSALGTALATGTATVTATLGGVIGSTLLTVTPASVVSISVSPTNAAIPAGLNQAFTALGTFTDGSTQNLTNSAHWSSSVPSVATVSNTPGSGGLATSASSGNTLISASSGSVTGSSNLTVTNLILAAIDISPQSPSVPIGGSQQFTATGLYTDGSTANVTTSVTWASSSTTVATISNIPGSQGLATSAGQGMTTISAALGSVAGSTTMAAQDWVVSITVAPPTATILPGTNQQFSATATYASGLINDVTGAVLWSSSSPTVATINATGLATSVAIGQTLITASVGSISGSATLAVSASPMPTNFRVDISDGTTGQLFVSWDSMSGAKYYNLERSTNPTSGYTKVAACSGQANLKTLNTTTVMEACRDGSLTAGTHYYYQVQACYSNGCSSYSTPASNVPVSSNCTAAQMPSMVGVETLPAVSLVSSVVDPAVEFLPNNYEYAYYASPAVPRRNLLLINLPGSDEQCPGAGAFNNTAEKLGFDVICVNYSNLSEQIVMCQGDPACFGNVSQAKLDATGVCAAPGQSGCGTDPKTGQPYYLSNPADAITQRISMMLQYLNTHGYNQNGTNWGNYLSGTTPLWQNIVLAGHSQGGVMSTFAAYENVVARAINLSAPPQATLVNGVEVGATYLTNTPATNIRDIYGLVSVYDDLYQQGVFSAVWQLLGFTPANNDAEVKLNTNNPIGLNCNSGTPSHNFSTSAPPGPDGNGHDATLYLWNEDIYKFMLID